jgi:hypothetical protein
MANLAFRDEWVMVGGHVHYVTSERWFTKGSWRCVDATADGHRVTAIGRVQLQVPNRTGDVSAVHLNNVLLIPAMCCNGFNYDSLFDKVEIKRPLMECFSEGRPVCFGLYVGKGIKLQLHPKTEGRIHFTADDFTSVWLSHRERENLFGRGALYPFE